MSDGRGYGDGLISIGYGHGDGCYGASGPGSGYGYGDGSGYGGWWIDGSGWSSLKAEWDFLWAGRAYWLEIVPWTPGDGSE